MLKRARYLIALLTFAGWAPWAASAQEPAIQPPRVLSMPALLVPPELALPDDGRVEVEGFGPEMALPH